MKKFFLESLKDTATNLAAESAAKYKIYLERENAAAREAAKNSANQMKIVGARNFAWAYYYAVLEILYTAILNVFPQIYMFPLRSAKQLIAPTIVGISDQGYYYFVFRGWYKRGYVTAPDMQQTLQSEIDALTSTVYRFPRLRIAVTFGENGRVIFRIAFEADVKGALT